MANKFTRSVLERQQNPMNRIAETAVTEPAILPEIALEQEEAVCPPDADSTSCGIDELDAYLQPVEGRHAKNKTFYLDQEVIEAIRTHAKKRGLTESYMVNEILRRIFIASSKTAQISPKSSL